VIKLFDEYIKNMARVGRPYPSESLKKFRQTVRPVSVPVQCMCGYMYVRVYVSRNEDVSICVRFLLGACAKNVKYIHIYIHIHINIIYVCVYTYTNAYHNNRN
jgi:hypothetical protein